jgi:DNA-binding NarL/FixJ family response regulator
LDQAGVHVLGAAPSDDAGLYARISETPGEPVAFVCPVPSARHLSGLEGLLQRHPTTPVAAFAIEANPTLGRKVREMGARGYSHFDAGPQETLSLIHRLAAGETWFDALDPADQTQSAKPPQAPDMESRLSRLTRRERQVMDLLGQGYANREIAEALGLREGTIRIYVHRVIRQLGLRNRVDVALCASRRSRAD